MEDVEDANLGSTSAKWTGWITMTTHQPISNSNEQRYKIQWIIISTFQDNILLSVVSMTNLDQI